MRSTPKISKPKKRKYENNTDNKEEIVFVETTAKNSNEKDTYSNKLM